MLIQLQCVGLTNLYKCITIALLKSWGLAPRNLYENSHGFPGAKACVTNLPVALARALPIRRGTFANL